MDVFNMLSASAQDGAEAADTRRRNHQYCTRHATTAQETAEGADSHYVTSQRSNKGGNSAVAAPGLTRGSPAKKDQRHVVFQLIDPKDPRIQARLPMRVMISPHDTTESIITTVKNFYGLYEYGVSFENEERISIIAAFDNFHNDMTVYVRTVSPTMSAGNDRAKDSVSPKRPTLGAPIEMRPPGTLGVQQSPSRAVVRSAGVRSVSPHPEVGRRSVSAAPGIKPRAQRTKSKEHGAMGDAEGYSSGDDGSVTSSRRSKAEEIKAEITVDNIVEGGRRKRAFESSELPLFVPPQVPMSASTSSISPQRRYGPNAASPHAQLNQQTFSHMQPLPSPQSFTNGTSYMQPPFSNNLYQNSSQQPSKQSRDSRANHGSNRHSVGGIMATPDPTIGSVISDEDVALQLMRLGDPSAFSFGRTSMSTVDDALSGKAEIASSDEDGDDEEEGDDEGAKGSKLVSEARHPDMCQHKKQRTMNELQSDGTSGEEYEERGDSTFGGDEANSDVQRKSSKSRDKARSAVNGGKPNRLRALSTSKPKKASVSTATIPMSPASLPSQSRKASISSSINFQHQLGADEEDLSSKPRCQRCRKSKKGCDRQRPCGRCRDAGLTAADCISEDEGNGRKGRYGRHMGVTIKKAEESLSSISPHVTQIPAPANGYFLAPALPDKNKKRKR